MKKHKLLNIILTLQLISAVSAFLAEVAAAIRGALGFWAAAGLVTGVAV